MANFTKQAIKAAFLELLDEKPLNKISVRDIVERCGINRNSFYYHFQDIPSLLGEIIAGFHAGYAKERPADIRPDPRAITDVDQWRLYLDKILYPDHKLMPQHRRWIGYTLKFAVGSLLSHCPGREERFLTPVFAYYRRPEDLDDYTAFQLLDTAAALPDTAYTASRARQMMDFAAALSLRKDLTIRMAAVLLLGLGVVDALMLDGGGSTQGI